MVKDDFNWTYGNVREEQLGILNFLSNLREINEHNLRHKAGLVSYTRSLSFLSDKSISFINEYMNGFIRPVQTRAYKQDEVDFVPPKTLNWVTRGFVTPGKCSECFDDFYCFSFSKSSKSEIVWLLLGFLCDRGDWRTNVQPDEKTDETFWAEFNRLQSERRSRKLRLQRRRHDHRFQLHYRTERCRNGIKIFLQSSRYIRLRFPKVDVGSHLDFIWNNRIGKRAPSAGLGRQTWTSCNCHRCLAIIFSKLQKWNLLRPEVLKRNQPCGVALWIWNWEEQRLLACEKLLWRSMGRQGVKIMCWWIQKLILLPQVY